MGNGRVGAMLLGAAGVERLYVNRYDRWEDGWDGEIPDVSHTLEETRALIRAGEYTRANVLLSKTLAEKGYGTPMAAPKAPAELPIRFFFDKPYTGLERGIDLDEGEVYARFKSGDMQVEKRAFVSFADDTVYLEMSATGAMEVHIDPCQEIVWEATLPEGGKMETVGDVVEITGARKILIRAGWGSLPEWKDYDTAHKAHLPLYTQAMGDVTLSFGGGNTCNEDLLDRAMEGPASCELLEKMWRMGRYLFACGTAQGGYPFPLYGLWNGTDHMPWAQHVANENVQMIYWHATVGGMAALLKPLIEYYYNKMDMFREAARKVFGCGGIFVSVYTTPMNSTPSPNVPVIVNYVSAAGWLCRHFYDYYLYTGDEETFREKILPFMLETAKFYEDYVIKDEQGRTLLMPSVSPENTPGNFMPHDFNENMGHVNPVVWNSTMEVAIMKEVLTALLAMGNEIGVEAARVARWKDILENIPAYMVNKDGAAKEWMDEKLEDFYIHRHLSHIYPVFPGNEIGAEDPLMPAFEKAVDLRELQGQSGWSLTHMAAIYSRFGRGEAAAECLDTLCRSCVLSNLFTLHNDWRDMGATLRIDMFPVQLDALMGVVNAVQEMLFRPTQKELRFLPARPERMKIGAAQNWRFPGGKASFGWSSSDFTATITAQKDIDIVCVLPDGTKKQVVLAAGESENLRCQL